MASTTAPLSSASFPSNPENQHEYLLVLVTGLTDRARRRATAKDLAVYLGGEDLIVFIRDAEIDVLLPAPGFPQTLPGGRVWRDFLSECLRKPIHTAVLPWPELPTERLATGAAAQDGSVLILRGGTAHLEDLHTVRLLLPLLAAAFQRERIALLAESHAALAQESSAQAKALAESLDVARRELQSALAEARAARQQAAFLASASQILSVSFDSDANLTALARFAVPMIADGCLIDRLTVDGRLQRVATAHRDPDKEVILQREISHSPFEASASFGVDRVIYSREPELYAEIPQAQPQSSNPAHAFLSILQQLNCTSYLCVPVLAQERILGTLTLLTDASGRRYGREDLLLVIELGQRVALALENGRLYQEAQQAIRIRDQFLAVASHELKTPLTALLGNAQFLLRRLSRAELLSERDQRLVKGIAEQATRLSKMVSALLDISRIQSGQLSIERQRMDLRALTERLVAEVQPLLERHTLAVTDWPEPLIIEGDELRLEQALQNLIQNAIKYSPDGGTIHVRLAGQADMACVEVSDQGIGIPSQALPHIFQRFYRAPNVDGGHVSGIGIGLHVTQEIMTLHNGKVTVRSEEGKGSTFTICLPLVDSPLMPSR